MLHTPGEIASTCDRSSTDTNKTQRAGLAAINSTAHTYDMITIRRLIWAYAILGVLTLVFQIWWRSSQCGDACALSYAKAVVWSTIWPASWVAFLKGFV